MDYSKLKPFDESVKAGDKVLYWYWKAEMARALDYTFVAGPDDQGYFVCKDESGCFAFAKPNGMWIPPLCWVEDRPVYRGDVLWYKGGDFSVRITGYNHRVKDNSGLEGVIVDGGKSYRAGENMWAEIKSWTWDKPKTKKQAWAVFKPVESSATGLMALPYPYHSREAAEIAFPDYHICLIEWEV